MDDAYRLAIRHHHAGRRAEAEEAYRRTLTTHPQHAGALHGLGTLALQADEPMLAEQLIRRAIAIHGEWPEACYHLGLALQARERFDDAITAHRRAAALKPDLFDAHYNLAVCLQLTGQRDKAIAVYRQAISLRGDDPVALNNFAIALQTAGKLEEAIAVLRHAVSLKPDFAEGFAQLAAALREAGRVDEAIPALSRSSELKPGAFATWMDLATAHRDIGRIDLAIAAARRAVAQRSDDADANCLLGNLLLLTGNAAEGLTKLAWRWRRKTPPWPRRKMGQLPWDGSDLTGRTIYLHGEQSFSDTIHFARFIPLVGDRGAKLVVEIQPALRRLFAGSFGPIVHRWFSPGEPAPPFDVYCPLMELMSLCEPARVKTPYLIAPVAERLDGRPSRKVGLAWAGSRSEIADRDRSMSLADLAPLADISGIEFFSLQRSRPADGWKSRLNHVADRWTDFADTAATIHQLDLIITVDTAIAHLAGALGKNVWTLLPMVPHWRWQMRGESTPWYPTMRLFRQTTRGDWGGVVRRVAAELSRGSR